METKQKATRKKSWALLQVPDDVRGVPPGFAVKVLSWDAKYLFPLSSGHLQYTNGLQEYATRYNLEGPRTSLPRLCESFHTEAMCPQGGSCSCVHAPVFVKCDLEAPPPPSIQRFVIHVNDASLPKNRYPVFIVPGTIEVCYPNTSRSPQIMSLTSVYRTKGVEEYLKDGRVHDASTSMVRSHVVKLQHCAHYAKNGMCQLGAECSFVHAVEVVLTEPPPEPTTPSPAPADPAIAPIIYDPWKDRTKFFACPPPLVSPPGMAFPPMMMFVPAAPGTVVSMGPPSGPSSPGIPTPPLWAFQSTGPTYIMFPPMAEASLESSCL